MQTLNEIQIIESDQSLQTYQLSDFIKELIGIQWVKQFNTWSEHALPKQPACYWTGDGKMIMHPSIAQAMQNEARRL